MASLLNALIGEYRVVESLGAGGMGEVYKAVHTHLGRVIAIKVLSPDLADGPALRRFYDEAGIQAGLKHPGVAEYLGFYEYQGRPCILMEYVDGDTLASLIRRGPLELEEAVRILRDIASVAANFHAQGVVHRDLKCNNVKINSAGRVKILDFGIARHERSDRRTRLGAVIGTPDALAPEQIRGAAVTPATDVWQLGVMFYELLTGRLPFQAATEREMYAKILAADYPPAGKWQPAVPPGIEKIVAHSLQKDPAKRYATARDLYDALCQWESGPGREAAGAHAPPAIAPARPSAEAPRGGPAGWPRALTLPLTGLGSAALVIALVAVIRGWNQPPPPSPLAPAIAVPADMKTDVKTDMKALVVDTMDGPAQVFRAGSLVGATPFRIQARPGEKVELVLRRDGYKDLPLEFELTTERHNYTYTMERIGSTDPFRGH